MNARPTLRQLSYLIALEDESSFSRAALLCHVTQSTLSAGIKELEDILGQSLVNRAGRKISLTPLGEEISVKAREILHDIDALCARARATQAALSGVLRVGVIPTIAPYFLPRILPELTRRFPALELQLFEDLSAHLLEKLHQGRVDALLIAFPYETDGFEKRELFREDFYVAAPKDKNLPETLSLHDLKPEELLLLEDGHCLRDHALDACKLQLPNTRKTFSATSLATLIQMVAHGYGITLLPEMVVRQAAFPDTITIIPFTSPAPSRTIGIVWNKNSPQSRDVLALIEAFKYMVECK